MKSKILILSPLLLTLLIYLASCCKENICVNKLAGKYKCNVTGIYYRFSDTDTLFRDSLIIQNINVIDDTTLSVDITVGNKLLISDKITIEHKAITNDTIYFDNEKTIYNVTNPIRNVWGYFVGRNITMYIALLYDPNSYEYYIYNGKKKII